MPKLTRSLPKYGKHKASGQAVVTIDSTDIYLGPHGTKASRIECDRIIAEYLANGRRLAAPSEQSFSVAEVLNAYRKHASKYYVKDGKPTKELAAMKQVIRSVRKLYSKQPATDFGPLALKAIRERWIVAGHARKTVNSNTHRVVRIFKWAASEELIPASVHHGLKTVDGLKKGRTEARESTPIKPIDLLTVERTMSYLCDVVRDMIRVQLLTGMRPSEACAIRPLDIDREDDVWEYRPESHKTEHHGRERIIYVGPEAQAVLAPYLLRAENSYCFSPREAVKQQQASQHESRVTPIHHGNRPGFCRSGLAGKKAKRRPGEKYTTDSYRRAIHRACDLAYPPGEQLSDDALKIWKGKHRWSPNRLRHTRGTEVRKEFGLEAAQVILGHSAANVTEIYAERDAEKAREVARRTG